MSTFLFSETEFAKPKPSIDNPRKIVFSIDTNNDKIVNHVISTVNNVIKYYRPENTEVVVVVYSQGVKVLLKNSNDHTRKRIEALMTYDIEFVACENSLRTLGIKKNELIDDLSFGKAGIVEIIEHQLRGFVYIKL
ncbi:MAG: DsrE family protein [Sulfurovum sp.]|nr:DsrE family protein [Sulfurovum sp.]MCB4745291.1 DsrE family protein [Sulfurovum sp.]MCB4745745.1 DsrE family protein [Sulfurovum sp.]MCB4749294.1 DsrE family protein [Sulfurovum sp.]MCB4750280.1 DsrE family protein [Sulfurovum sp.]